MRERERRIRRERISFFFFLWRHFFLSLSLNSFKKMFSLSAFSPKNFLFFKFQSDRVDIHAQVALQPLVRDPRSLVQLQLPDAADPQVPREAVPSDADPLERDDVGARRCHQLPHLVVAPLGDDDADPVSREGVAAALGGRGVDSQGLYQSSVDLAAVGDGLEFFAGRFSRERRDVFSGQALLIVLVFEEGFG